MQGIRHCSPPCHETLPATLQLTLSTYAHSFGSTHPSPWDAITPPTWGEAHQKVIRQGGNTTSFLSGS